ncbi:MAG: UDP-4-amino-4,6-dideoxy-N-acetyl-beta-L-altrosamine transaminase [Lachnospiraceae bacterium]|nr:UDP-4-amino-4,6-dideoxy-N-acetyl-beta-L-altrosamine transaminase [Lachnospiraceae bacterium]MDE6251998.1 UDP-4-amino-4,6-dideoxy-N-acetyl-beta-L-altrosamine transaminase [Lachnospiraceae bacterium]
MKYIPYGKQNIDEDDINAVVEVLKSDYVTTGPKVSEFEKKVADYCGAEYAVAIANGTAALHAACMAAGIGPGDEVITTPITFVASSNCVLYCGGTPVFADIDPHTYNIDPEDIERKITPKTKAVIAVHLTGQPCDMERIHAIAKKYNLLVIEDAAHALGAEYKGHKIGSISDMTTFSFHPVKHITTGEGGMILTNNKDLYEKLLLARTHGITKNQDVMERCDGGWYYEQQSLGYNYRITDIQCALGISQMNKLDRFVEERRKIAGIYDEAFKNCPQITVPYQMDECKNSYHLYVIQVKNRKEVFDKMREAGIGVIVHYIPVYTQPYYRNNGYDSVICKNAERYYESALSLPIYPGLTEDEQQYVIDKVMEYACL